jgi:predicted HTH domain antitoxin
MHAVNVHQLKNNPSEALRKVKDAPVIVMKGDRPTALMLNLDDEALLSQPDVKLALATELFRCGHLSLGRAARLAEMAVVDFMRHLSARGIPVIRSTADEAKADLEARKPSKRTDSRQRKEPAR